MPPRLAVLLPSPSSAYPPTIPCPVNSSTPTRISNPHFEGEISIWVKDYSGERKEGDGAEYFGVEGREEMTYGIVVRGRFLQEMDGDEVVFGNVFEKPIRDSLPWGTSIATKFMYFIDPTLELDIYADKPWALSPLISTMNHLSLSPTPPPSPSPPTITESVLPTPLPSTRRKHFSTAPLRAATPLGPGTYVGAEFSNGLLDFNTLSATLPKPFHLSVPLLKYWDGQPVVYVCRERVKEGKGVGEGKVFWSVGFTIVDKGDGEGVGEKAAGEGKEKEVGKKEEAISDDVD